MVPQPPDPFPSRSLELIFNPASFAAAVNDLNCHQCPRTTRFCGLDKPRVMPIEPAFEILALSDIDSLSPAIANGVNIKIHEMPTGRSRAMLLGRDKPAARSCSA